MNNFLLAMEWFTKLSDVITEKWPQVIAIFTSSAFITFAFTVLGKLILTAIDNRARKKTEVPLLGQFTKFEKALNERFNQLESANNEMMNGYIQALDTKLNQTLIDYQNKKTQLYNDIYEEQQQCEEILLNSVKTIEETGETIIPEQIITIEEKVSENANLEAKSVNGEYKIAKRVINNDEE